MVSSSILESVESPRTDRRTPPFVQLLCFHPSPKKQVNQAKAASPPLVLHSIVWLAGVELYYTGREFLNRATVSPINHPWISSRKPRTCGANRAPFAPFFWLPLLGGISFSACNHLSDRFPPPPTPSGDHWPPLFTFSRLDSQRWSPSPASPNQRPFRQKAPNPLPLTPVLNSSNPPDPTPASSQDVRRTTRQLQDPSGAE